MRHQKLALRFLFLLIAIIITHADAQEPTYMDAATHPGAGQFYSRFLVSKSEYTESETETEEIAATLKLIYGIYFKLAVLAEFKFATISANDLDEYGLLQSTFQFKYRLFKNDLGPLNTWMASAFAGVTVPGDIDKKTKTDAYPRFALVSTAILGRNGINAELEWETYGKEPDLFIFNASYLYRIAPGEYAAHTRGAWYSMVESLNKVTDDGDSRFDVAVGILYEARRWALEASIKMPIEQNWTIKEDYNITLGARFLP